MQLIINRDPRIASEKQRRELDQRLQDAQDEANQ